MKPDARWLASEDFIGLGEVEFEIAAVYQNSGETMQDGKKKDFFSVGFTKTPKQLVLNATNRKTLSGAFFDNPSGRPPKKDVRRVQKPRSPAQ